MKRQLSANAPHLRQKSRLQRGYILVETLILIAALVALLAVLAADQRAAMREVQDRLQQRHAEVAARSGLARAMAVLQTANSNLVTLQDDWAVLGNNGDESFDLGNGVTFRLQILDQGSLANINTLTQAQLQQLPLTQEQIDCLLDWRETGLQARADGAKDDYYNNLQQPYNTRLGLLTTVDELALIKNWTGRMIYYPITDVTPLSATGITLQDDQGKPLPLIDVLTAESGSPNTRADGTARINFGTRNLSVAALQRLGFTIQVATQIVARAPFSSFQTLLSVPGVTANTTQQLLNAATFTAVARSTGLIDLNTAPQTVLMTIPNITQDVASAIVSRQQTGGFATMGDLASIPGLTAGNLLGRVADATTIGGDTWLVRAYGLDNGVGTAIEATVGLRNGRAEVETWRRVSTSGIPNWWHWNQDTTATVDPGGGL